MKKNIHLQLNRLIDYRFSILEYGWAPTSILHRVSTEGHVDRGRPGPNILCPDMPGDLSGVQRAFLALPSNYQQVITVKYMPYSVYSIDTESFRRATDKDRARFMGWGVTKFKEEYEQAAKRVSRIIKSDNIQRVSGQSG